MKLFEAFANMFRVPDLRKRLGMFTLGLLAVYPLLGGRIPTPGINLQQSAQFLQYTGRR